jgi:hypothetical protein
VRSALLRKSLTDLTRRRARMLFTVATLALAGTLALALVIMLAPLRRAVRLKPGGALRYA